MGHFPTSMLFLILISTVALANSFPFIGKVSSTESSANKHKRKEEIDEKETARININMKDDFFVTDRSKVIDIEVTTMPTYFPSPGVRDNGLKNENVGDVQKGKLHEEQTTELLQKVIKDMHERLGNLNNTKTNGLYQSKDFIDKAVRNHFHISQKFTQLDSFIKGFLRETIYVPEHRKRNRHKRSIFDFDFSEDFPEEEPDFFVFSAHTSPCEERDRYYCLNGGTCVFVGALEIRTCRCTIGYTGERCEMINQEFLLALLTENFFR